MNHTDPRTAYQRSAPAASKPTSGRVLEKPGLPAPNINAYAQAILIEPGITMHPIHSLGYEGASINEIIHTLQHAGVELLLDIREAPISRELVALMGTRRAALLCYERDP